MVKIATINKLKLSAALPLIALLLISGCGFKLRGSGFESLSGQKVFLQSKDPYGALERNLRGKLGDYAIDTDNVPVTVSESTDFLTEKNGIRINAIKLQKRVLSVDGNGRPAEYEMIIEVDVSFRFANNSQLQAKQFAVHRDYRYDKNNSLANDRELEMLISAMHDDLAQRIIGVFLGQLAQQTIGQ